MTDPNAVPNCISVVFPGIVNHVDKFLDLIGGITALEKVTSSRSDRLEMRFRPLDVHSHAVYGDRVSQLLPPPHSCPV
jgi:hypothetical protein